MSKYDELSRIGLSDEIEKEIRKNLDEGNKAAAIHLLKQNFSCTLQQCRDILNNVPVISQAEQLIEKGHHRVKLMSNSDSWLSRSYVCIRCGKTEDYENGELVGLPLSQQECN